MQLKSEHTLVATDVHVAESKIADLKNQQDITNSQIRDILTEKREIEKRNEEYDMKLQGRGKNENENKQRKIDEERKQTLKIAASLEFCKEEQEKMDTQLSSEEAKAKKELDDKITAEQQMEDETDKAKEEAEKRLKNREELIKLQLRLSLLKSANETVTAELADQTKKNVELKKENLDLEKFNEKETEQIELCLQRIQISALLKEIDVEEMRQLANSNETLNSAFIKIFTQWERIAPGGGRK